MKSHHPSLVFMVILVSLLLITLIGMANMRHQIMSLHKELEACQAKMENCQGRIDYWRTETHRRAFFIEAVAWEKWVVAQGGEPKTIEVANSN